MPKDDDVVENESESLRLPSAEMRLHPVHRGRFQFCYGGAPIYEWEQTLGEVRLYVQRPQVNGQKVKASQIVCKIMSNKLQLGLRGADRFFLDEETFGLVDTQESVWTLEDNYIVIDMQKANKGLVWEAALNGTPHPSHELPDISARLDPFQLEQVRKDLMIERYQEEHPGMDFRDAEFNGSVPDPRTFMGGVQY